MIKKYPERRNHSDKWSLSFVPKVYVKAVKFRG